LRPGANPSDEAEEEEVTEEDEEVGWEGGRGVAEKEKEETEKEQEEEEETEKEQEEESLIKDLRKSLILREKKERKRPQINVPIIAGNDC